MNPHDYLAVVTHSNSSHVMDNINVLVSGADKAVHAFFVDDVISKCRAAGKMLVLIDDSGFINSSGVAALMASGWAVINLLSGEICLFDPLNLSSLEGMTQMRQLVEAMGFDEGKKQKLFCYLNFIAYLDKLASDDEHLTLFKLLYDYGSSAMVMAKVKDLICKGVIDEDQEGYLLSRYSEVAGIAPDFENLMFSLSPFISAEKEAITAKRNSAIILPLFELDGDDNLKAGIMCLLRFGLKKLPPNTYHILIADKGYGARKQLVDFVGKAADADMTLISKDIFSLGDECLIGTLMQRFDARVYARHAAESSCIALEAALGETKVVKSTYTLHCDRRWSANKPLDVLFGKNKSETYGSLSPAYEARYRRELIASLPPGTAILEYQGNSSIVSCR